MLNRRRGERVEVDEIVEITLIEQDFQTRGPYTVDEVSYEFGRKHGVHLNLFLTGLRFTGNIELDVAQEITFMVPEQQEPLKGSVIWKKKVNEIEFMYGIKVLLFLNRRRNDRVDLAEPVEMTFIEPNQSENLSFVEEMSYGLGRKHGVHLSPRVTGLRFRSTVNFNQEQVISFRVSSEEETLKGSVAWKVKKDDIYWQYGVQII